MDRSYIAFISYKHTERDAAIAKQVHTLIESYVIPKSLRKDSKKLGIVFRDEEELPVSSDLTESICTALDTSRYLIVICSPESKESPWVAREVNYFLKNHDAKDAFVVLVKGEPNDVFPYELTHILNEKTGEYMEVEPLAMDVRADRISDSLKRVKSQIKKLYAGMLGCSYDSLVQREKTRRLKRLVTMAVLCALLVGSFIGMLFVKNRELSQKNEELTAAIELALNRESELLVEQADEALQEGDVAAAIKYASDALYSEDVERPYCAPAERVLFSAADVLHEETDRPLLKKVALKHHSPIEMMTYCADGGAVCAIDAYGMVRCFDSSSGDLLWSVKLREHPNVFNNPVASQIWYDDENNIVACYYDDVLSGLNASTGALSWKTELKNTVAGGLFFDEEGKKLAYVEKQYFSNPDDNTKDYDKYNFIALSTRDGSVLDMIPFDWLTENATRFDSIRFDRSGNCHSTGMFAGSNGFVGTLFRTDDDSVETLFYAVDLAEDHVIFVKNETIDDASDYMRTFYIGNNRALVLTNKVNSDVQALTFDQDLCLQCFDMKTGDILWESIAEAETYIPEDSNCFVVPRAADTVLGVGRYMYLIDHETGEIKASARLYDDVIEMHPIGDGLFGFTLANGYCAVGWSDDEYGLRDSQSFFAYVVLPDAPDVIHYNGGLLQAHFTENEIDGFSTLPLQDGGGSITYLSQDRCIAYVASPLPGMALPAPIPVEIGDLNSSSMGKFLDVTPDGKVLMGPATLKEGRGLTIVDTENHTLETVAVDDSLGLYSIGDKIYLTSDGQKILMCKESGDMRSVALDGSVSVLAEPEDMLLQTWDDVDYMAYVYRADAARQASDGRIVAARSDGRQLTYWMDGGEETTVQLPEDVRGSFVDLLTIRSMVHVGENGLVVLGDFVSEDVREIENFAVYDLSSGKWKQIPDVAHGSEERLVVFSQNAPMFAVYDADMNIRIYDWNAAEPVHCIHTELPMVSAMEIGMMLDDQYIYVLTEDGRFMIYSIATSEMVFHTEFSTILFEGGFSYWLDRANERLYLRANTDVLCIDLRTWEQLFSGKDFKFYSAAQNEAYISSYDSLQAIPIPTTSELIDMARDVLP